ncbi:MAG: S8 family serine peptidase [Paucibacter sp.]|nr:S8 family serine peptidase [Roseateles sp.]
MRRWLLALALSLLSLAVSASNTDEPRSADRQLLVMLQLPKAHFRPEASYGGSYGDTQGLALRKRQAEALARSHRLEFQSEWPMPLAEVDCFVMRLAAEDPRSLEQVAVEIEADKTVAWAQPVNEFRAHGTADEPLYATQPAAGQWHLAALHELATGRGVKVAVIDSGVAAEHPDLTGQLSLNENFVEDRAFAPEQHGTAVAGIIAARNDNGQGIAGVAPGARLLGLRACWQQGNGETLCNSLSLARALQAAVTNGAQVINMSLGGPRDRLLGVLIDQAMARGASVVAALGRSAADSFPASHPGVLAVGAGPPLPAGAVQAPGRDVPSTAANGGWTLVTGSSFSSAHAAGLLALLRELDGSKLRPLQAGLVMGQQGRIDSCATLTRHAAITPKGCLEEALRHTGD